MRGNGATILLYNLEQRTVVLTRQLRLPAHANGHSRAEGGDIEVIEPGFEQAIALVASGEIADGKPSCCCSTCHCI